MRHALACTVQSTSGTWSKSTRVQERKRAGDVNSTRARGRQLLQRIAMASVEPNVSFDGGIDGLIRRSVKRTHALFSADEAFFGVDAADRSFVLFGCFMASYGFVRLTQCTQDKAKAREQDRIRVRQCARPAHGPRDAAKGRRRRTCSTCSRRRCCATKATGGRALVSKHRHQRHQLVTSVSTQATASIARPADVAFSIVDQEEGDENAQARLSSSVEAHARHLGSSGLGKERRSRARQPVVLHRRRRPCHQSLSHPHLLKSE